MLGISWDFNMKQPEPGDSTWVAWSIWSGSRSPGRRVTALPGGKCRPRSPSSEAPHFEGKEMMRRCYDCYVCYVYVCIIYIQFYIVFMYVCIYICLYYCMLACMSKSCLVPWRISVRCHARKRTKSSQFLPQPVEHDSMTTTTK